MTTPLPVVSASLLLAMEGTRYAQAETVATDAENSAMAAVGSETTPFTEDQIDQLKAPILEMLRRSAEAGRFSEDMFEKQWKMFKEAYLNNKQIAAGTGVGKTLPQAILAGVLMAQGQNTLWMVNDKGDVDKFVDQPQNITNVMHQELVSLVVNRLTNGRRNIAQPLVNLETLEQQREKAKEGGDSDLINAIERQMIEYLQDPNVIKVVSTEKRGFLTITMSSEQNATDVRKAVDSLQEAVVDEIQNFVALYNFVVSNSGPLKKNTFASQMRDKVEEFLPKVKTAIQEAKDTGNNSGLEIIRSRQEYLDRMSKHEKGKLYVLYTDSPDPEAPMEGHLAIPESTYQAFDIDANDSIDPDGVL